MRAHSSGGRRTDVGIGNKGKDTYKQTRDLNGPMTIEHAINQGVYLNPPLRFKNIYNKQNNTLSYHCTVRNGKTA